MALSWPILSTLVWTPIVGGALCTVLPERFARYWSLFISLACLALVWPLLSVFDPSDVNFQFTEYCAWFPAMQIAYAMGVDGISLPLLVLSCFLGPLIIYLAHQSIHTRYSQYVGAFLILQGLMCGVFCAVDALLFYVFFEALLIPMFLIIGIWGGPNRVYATVKFFLYTFLGSIFLLIALIYLYLSAKGLEVPAPFAFSVLHALPLSLIEQKWLFGAMVFAFAVKIPMWPVHTWLPDAHVEAPTGGSVILAAVLLKMGGYGMLRLLLPTVPDACRYFAEPMVILALIAVVYIGLVAIIQQDMKKLIAYSSVAHMGFVTLGIFGIFLLQGEAISVDTRLLAISGAYIQMISHGLVSAALFFSVGVLYDRVHSRNIADYGGVINRMPAFATLFMIFAMANAGLPGTSGFVGECMVILSAMSMELWIALAAGMTLVLSAGYTLWMYKRVVFGKATRPAVLALQDLNYREYLVLGILAVSILVCGIFPKPLLDLSVPSLTQVLEQAFKTKIGA